MQNEKPTPFSEMLAQAMHEKRMKATALAAMVEVSPGYISSLLSARKTPPAELARRIGAALEMDEMNQAKIVRAAEISRRRVEIPEGAPRGLYEVVHEIVDRATHLQPEQLQAIRLIAQLPTTAANEERNEAPGARKMKP